MVKEREISPNADAMTQMRNDGSSGDGRTYLDSGYILKIKLKIKRLC